MLKQKAFVKKTKKGNITKVVREHYLRDDIWSGSPLDPECPPDAHKLGPGPGPYLVIDTNVALHQLDFLEHPAVTDVIVTKTVLEEVEHRNRACFQRLRALAAADSKRFYVFSNEHHRATYLEAAPGESPNDRNDRAIRAVAKWYKERVPSLRVLLLTNDAANRALAASEGVEALHLAAYARERRSDAPELMDLVARAELEDDETGPAAGGGGGGGGRRATKRKKVYEQHRPFAELQSGIAAGRLHQGALRVSRFNAFEGWVSSQSVGDDILVSGRIDMNRALDGDIVAVELLPEEQWRAPSKALPGGGGAGGAGGGDEASDESEEGGSDGKDAAGAGIFQVAPGEALAEEGAGGKGAKRPTGRVVGVIKRNWRQRGYCGSLRPEEGAGASGGPESVLFVPVERRFPMIRITTRQAAALMSQRIVVAIDGWEADSMYPGGHYVRSLGAIGDKDTETEVLLIENDINTAPFTPAVHDCVPPLPWSVTDTDLADPNREDLRHLPICSVDPPGCKDIDDALHVRELPNGNLEVGVHIADVTHFLKPGTAMDDEAAARATTTYLVQRRIDMLPKPLTEDICSLRGGVERLTFSAIWEMTRDAEIVSTRFTKAAIRSRAAMTYAEAQARIDDATQSDEITLGLRHLLALAKKLRAARVARGALQLASPEVKFDLADDDTHDPIDVGVYQLRETNSMVEEFMLLANVAVAAAIVERYPTCSLLRRHQTPEPRMFEPLLRAGAAAGFGLDTSSSRALADSLDGAVRGDDSYFNKLVRIMATRCMTQAAYFGSGDVAAAEYHHYGLASPIYTHFTSPIRRYADVVVHRLLGALLGLAPLPDAVRDRDALRGCADNLNARHRNAQMAGRASVELHTLIFFRSREVVADARVTKVKANGLIVFVPRYGIEGPVYLTPKGGGGDGGGGGGDAQAPQFVLDEERQVVTSADGALRFAVFDKCAVRIRVEEGAGHRRALVLSLVPRGELPAGEIMA
ncbi:MAG: hypothetical protein J3K34DRAFT_526194 [Monoraphidium minutum]|nr:MAG: hypothetical protein J3K34DRAFT_526194 [Monoraphidium minutum]